MHLVFITGRTRNLANLEWLLGNSEIGRDALVIELFNSAMCEQTILVITDGPGIQ